LTNHRTLILINQNKIFARWNNRPMAMHDRVFGAIEGTPMPVKVTISRRARRGFTLIELLVLTAIIGMLISLLFPSMRARTTNARRTRFTIFLLAGFRAPLQRCAHVP
jgi:prepilin-type N-terminal cleavage/methylation domain-containing protein